MHPELQRLLDDIDACERRAEAIVADLDDKSVNWKPPPGTSWSVAQCLHHLAVMNEFYLRGTVERVQAARGHVGPFSGLRPTAFGRSFVGWLEPPARFKSKAPTQSTPAPAMPRDSLVPLFKTSHDVFRALVKAGADVDINRVTMPNPFYPRVKMRLSTVLLIIPAHDRRHLWQAENVKRSLRA